MKFCKLIKIISDFNKDTRLKISTYIVNQTRLENMQIEESSDYFDLNPFFFEISHGTISR